MKSEKWLPIESYPDYFISNHGSVKSKKWGKEKILKGVNVNDSGIYVGLYNVNDVMPKTTNIGKLVLDTFKPCKHKYHIVYIDGDIYNLELSNLTRAFNKHSDDHPYNIQCRYYNQSTRKKGTVEERIKKIDVNDPDKLDSWIESSESLMKKIKRKDAITKSKNE